MYIYLELSNTLKRIYLRFQAPWLNNKNTVSLMQTNVYTPDASKSHRAKKLLLPQVAQKTNQPRVGSALPTLKTSGFSFTP